MSESDIRVILERLARLETKIDERAADKSRLDRLERFMYLTLGIAIASGAPDLVALVS